MICTLKCAKSAADQILSRSLDRLLFWQMSRHGWIALSSGLLLLIELFGWAELHPASVKNHSPEDVVVDAVGHNQLVSAITRIAFDGQRYRYTFPEPRFWTLLSQL